MKLGGVTLPDPIWDYEGYEKAVNDIGAVHEMADGSLVYDHVGIRPAFVLRFRGLTGTEKNTCYTRYMVKTVQSFEPPDGASAVNVLVVPKSWREAYIEIDGSPRYQCEMALEAQQAS